MSDSLSHCPTCGGKGVLGGCGRDDCDHTHTYMFCPDCSNPQPQEGGVGGPVMAGSLCAACGQEGPSGFTVCDECEDGWVYPAPHGFDATDCPAFYDICRCEGTPCPSCRGSGLVPTDELRQAAADTGDGPRGGRPPVSDEKGREVWWCKTHESRFLEKQPSKYALCLLSLHERNFEAIGWEDCDPVLVRVVPVPVAAARAGKEKEK